MTQPDPPSDVEALVQLVQQLVRENRRLTSQLQQAIVRLEEALAGLPQKSAALTTEPTRPLTPSDPLEQRLPPALRLVENLKATDLGGLSIEEVIQGKFDDQPDVVLALRERQVI